MPRIPESYIDCLVYLYGSVEAAERSERVGGCGLLIGVEFRDIPNLHHVYAVTNFHVAEVCRVVRYNTKAGRPQCDDLSRSRWFSHQDGSDVSVCPLGFSAYFDERVTMVRAKSLLTRKRMSRIPLRFGDELFMVSRYINHEGDTENEPIARFGTLAKPRPVLVRDKGGDEEELFLAEVKSLPGHSGSPVFVYFHGMQPRLGADEVPPRAATYLLGIDSGLLPQPASVYEAAPSGREGPIDTGHFVYANSGISTVVPAWKITDILMCPELRLLRQRTESSQKDRSQ